MHLPPIVRHCAIVVLAAGVMSPPAGAQLRAERITPETAPELVIGGPDASGGVDDWYLGNDIVEIIVDDPGRLTGELNHGGTIVDAGLRDRTGEDQIGQLLPIVNLDQRVMLWFDTIRAEVNDAEGWARLVVSSSRGMSTVPRGGALARRFDPMVPPPGAVRGVYAETEYLVRRGEPFVRLKTTVHNSTASSVPIFSYADILIRGDKSMRGWLGNTVQPETSRGFHHVAFDVDDILHSEEAVAAFTYFSAAGVRYFPPIAYAVCSPERLESGRLSFGVTDEAYSGMAAFVFDPEWDRMTFLRMLRGTRLWPTRRYELPGGVTWTYERRLIIAGHNDVAATTDIVFPMLGFADGTSGIRGRVARTDLPHVVLITDARTGAPVTQAETPTAGPDAGTYRAVLPPGKYGLEIRAPQRPAERLEVTVPIHEFADAGVQRLAEPGYLVVQRAFSDGGPGRIIVKGEDGTPDPVFEPELFDFRVDDRLPATSTHTNSLYFVGNDTDPVRIAMPPGTYRLFATRGLEHAVVSATVQIAEGGREVVVAPFTVPRVIEVPGYVTADFHVHAQASDDSALPNLLRLRSYVAERVDVLTTTEHDHIGNFDAELDALRVRDRIRVVSGSEVTSSVPSPAAPYTLGHTNAWPLAYQPTAHRQGAPPSENMTLADFYARLRHEYGARVIQMNHPRRSSGDGPSSGSFLTHLGSAGEGYNPDVPMTEWPNRLLLQSSQDGTMRGVDFDAIEVMNGEAFGQFVRIRRDWYSFLKQGYAPTAVANSDTHRLEKPAGWPRTYVRYAPEPGAWDVYDFADAVRAGRAFGTNGPLFARFTVNGGEIGDVVRAEAGRVTVGLTVAAAPWVPVAEVRLVINGAVERVFQELPETQGAPVIRLDADVELVLDRDAFVTLEAGVSLPQDPDLPAPRIGGIYGDVVAPEHVPMAFTNPIFVDVDGNGRFDPPGVPPPPPGWGIAIPWSIFGGVAVLVVIALLLARRQRA